MKVCEILEHLAETRPNVYPDEVLVRWLSDIEGKIHNEIFRISEPFRPIKVTSDNDRELLVYEPYTNVYVHYLYSMIEFANCETVKYANSNALFNNLYSAFEADYVKKFRQPSPSWNNIWG